MPKIKGKRKRQRCFKNRYPVEKVYGSICDDCPKQKECYHVYPYWHESEKECEKLTLLP